MLVRRFRGAQCQDMTSLKIGKGVMKMGSHFISKGS